ncbi:hypothetical protein B0H13DRAFT_1951769 [Mycena leptocephala]|nr:hypothetical protein B0H13DRAFT_1951769 [Mycena leptocephala]
MTPEKKVPHSFNRSSLVFGELDPNPITCHRRYNSEPFNTLLGPRRKESALSLVDEQPHAVYANITLHPLPEHALAAPAPVSLLRLKPQYSIRRPRPDSEFFGASYSYTPEIVLGEPKEHIGHPKTRIGQPVLKLAAIKERMELLEAANERLQQRSESYRTDAEMLSSSVTYFSSEYYAGLLTIRDLRARSRQDAEIMSNQEQQLCQLKKFVGLMVEIGLHEPVLERAHEAVLAGKNLEPVLVEAIRNAAARRGSAWAGILSAINAPPDSIPAIVQTDDAPDVFEEPRQSTVDDLLKDLKDGNIPSGRHRSASQRFPDSNSPNGTLGVKSPKASGALLFPGSPTRCVLGKLDVNRSPPHQSVPRTHSSAIGLSSSAAKGRPHIVSTGDVPFSNQRALASLQHILDNFSSGSFGSLGTTTEGTQSGDCDSSAETEVQPQSSILRSPVAKSSPPRVCVHPPTACSTKRASAPATSKRSTAVPSSTKKSVELGSSFVSPSRRTSDSATPTSIASGNQAKKGWR